MCTDYFLMYKSETFFHCTALLLSCILHVTHLFVLKRQWLFFFFFMFQELWHPLRYLAVNPYTLNTSDIRPGLTAASLTCHWPVAALCSVPSSITATLGCKFSGYYKGRSVLLREREREREGEGERRLFVVSNCSFFMWPYPWHHCGDVEVTVVSRKLEACSSCPSGRWSWLTESSGFLFVAVACSQRGQGICWGK